MKIVNCNYCGCELTRDHLGANGIEKGNAVESSTRGVFYCPNHISMHASAKRYTNFHKAHMTEEEREKLKKDSTVAVGPFFDATKGNK